MSATLHERRLALRLAEAQENLAKQRLEAIEAELHRLEAKRRELADLHTEASRTTEAARAALNP